jgi:hypothetical protein
MDVPTNTTFTPIVAVQQAITQMLLAYEPGFLTFGQNIFIALATIMLVWYGVRMMLAPSGLGDNMFHFAKLLLLLSFGYAMVFFYQRPIPGIGQSFSTLITDQTLYLANIIDQHALANIEAHFDDLFSRFEEPDAWSILANLLYWMLLLVIGFTKVIAMAVVSFGLVASAVCALLGPLFLPFFVCPGLDWLFWGWLKAYLQYSFMPVVAYAFLFIFEKFVFAYLTTLPPYIPQDDYLVYSVQVLMILVSFVYAMWLVPSVNASIFSGQSGESIYSQPAPSTAARAVVSAFA